MRGTDPGYVIPRHSRPRFQVLSFRFRVGALGVFGFSFQDLCSGLSDLVYALTSEGKFP